MCFLQHMFWLAAHLTVIFSMYTLSSSRPEAGAALAKLCLGSHSPLVCSRFCFSLFPFPFCWFFFFFFFFFDGGFSRQKETGEGAEIIKCRS